MVKQAPKKRVRPNPLFGIVLGLTFALFAYLLAPYGEQILREQGVRFGTVQPQVVQLLVGGTIWFVMFGSAMFLVAMLSGRGTEEDHAIKFAKQTVKDRKLMKREREIKRRRNLEKNKRR